jgi:phosphoribosylaminoimidazole-succinocarboxamide synthase
VHHTTSNVVLETSISAWPLRARGKVRDVYERGNQLLIVATDRISAFDAVLATGIPRKGTVLTQLSLFWFDYLRAVVPNHLISVNVDTYPPELRPHNRVLAGRSMLVKRAEMVPVECVARGYLSGSAWKDYQSTGQVAGIRLPAGLRESDRLPEPIFTPATKAATGHDENITFDAMVASVGGDVAERLRTLTLALYKKAGTYAERKGIIIADTKFEFGFINDELILGDEVLTPDSSRFWPADTYAPGGPQFSYDKQYVRDYLETINWNKLPPAPALPAEVAARTSEKYVEAYHRLTGRPL